MIAKPTSNSKCSRQSRPKTGYKWGLLLLALLIVIPAWANAATHYAHPSDTGTGTINDIYYAVSNAIAGDVIECSAGSYTLGSGALFVDKDISIQGAPGTTPGSVILDCNGGICLDYTGTTPAASVADIMITNGSEGIWVEWGSLTIRRTLFQNNTTGLMVQRHGSVAHVEWSTFENCGVGAYALEHGSANIVESLFANNISGAKFKRTATSVIDSCEFDGNTFGTYLKAENGINELLVHHSAFLNNYNGVTLESTTGIANVAIRDNTFFSNTSYGIRITGPDNSTVFKNYFEDNYGGVGVYGGGSSVVSNNLILSSTKIGMYGGGSNAVFSYNTVSGGDIGFYSSVADVSLVANNIFHDNSSFGIRAEYSACTTIGNNNAYDNGTEREILCTACTCPVIGYRARTLSVDPDFIGTTDYRLSPTSALNGTADPTVHAVPEDILGVARGAYGVEPGCYEI